MGWTLESELCGAARASSVSEALAALGLLSNRNEQYELVTDGTWTRGGAETYLYSFAVTSDSGAYAVVLKACVAIGSLDGVERILSDWLHRRQALARFGIATPYLYFRHNGSIAEERIEMTVKEAIGRRDRSGQMEIIRQVGRLAAVLGWLGFPVLSLHDLRSRGDDVVLIEFGEDLGPQGMVSRDSTSALDVALEYVTNIDVGDRDAPGAALQCVGAIREQNDFRG